MLYLRLCLDKADALALREQHRADHRAYLQSGIAAIVQAGPLLGIEGQMVGSMIILEAGSMDEVERFHEGDPFTKVGLFDQVHMLQWDRHIG
ncbi:MAG: YCII-related protein [Bradyrhizobium sp.]|nr:YCII-related protein [Bradyrhizobium sp.]